MKTLHHYMCALLLLFVAGCGGTLAPEGVYKGDKVLYNADATLDTTKSTVDTFLVWEMTYRGVVGKDVTQAADRIRVEYPKVHAGYYSARDAYLLNPTPQNKTALENALSVARIMTTEVLKYMAPTK